MPNRTNPIRYIVRFPNQAYPVSYNVGLGLKQALFYADLTAKTHKGTIISQDADGTEELVGSYARDYSSRPHQPRDADGAPV